MRRFEMALDYEIVRDRTDRDTWRVEAIDYDDEGQIFVALFMGPKAELRAREYAAFKNGLGSDLDVDGSHAGLRA